MVQVVDEIAKKHRFALLAEAEHDVDLGARLVGHDGAQELDVAGGYFHVDHEVGARQREEQADAPGVEQDGVDVELAVGVVQHRDGKGVFVRPVDGLADDVGGLVAIEGRGQHLDLEIDLAPRHAVQETVNRLVDGIHIAIEVGKGAMPVEIADDLADCATQAVFLGVIAAVGLGVVALDVFGRDGWTDEDEIVVKVIAVQDLGGYRIEEGLGQFRLLVVEQQADIEQLDLLPGRIVDGGGVELVAQALDTLVHAVVVEADAFLHRLVHAQPVGLLETALGFAAGLAEQGVVLVEALDHGQGDLVRVGAVKADGYFHGRERQGSARNSSTGE